MPKSSRPRYGSLQFWPRKRIRKALPSVNWRPVSSSKILKEDGLLGLIAYKVGMATAYVKDNSEKSMTQGKRIAIPVTILEVPNMKIFAIRFLKNGIVSGDIIVSKDKELKRKLKVPKEIQKMPEKTDFDDVHAIIYSVVKHTGLKKSPDLIEVDIKAPNKLDFAKHLIEKEISLPEVLKWNLADTRGLTKGKGFSGPIKRFGLKLKSHKSEKGRRRPGSLGPWHPSRVTFMAPQAGQLGNFTRVHYNLRVIDSGSIKQKDINKKGGFKNYGIIKTSYIVLEGSVQGPSKRQILITPAMRPSRKQMKKKYEVVEIQP